MCNSVEKCTLSKTGYLPLISLPNVEGFCIDFFVLSTANCCLVEELEGYYMTVYMKETLSKNVYFTLNIKSFFLLSSIVTCYGAAHEIVFVVLFILI